MNRALDSRCGGNDGGQSKVPAGQRFLRVLHGAPGYRSFSTELDRAISRLRLAGRGESLNWVNGWRYSQKDGLLPGLRSHLPGFDPLSLGLSSPRNSDGNPDSPQAAVFLTSIIDVTVGS